MKRITWKALVRDVVERMPREFSLSDVLRERDHFARFYPENRFVDAKIRQSLQLLRDQQVIRFLGAGRYERTGDQPRFSPLLNPETASDYSSRSQIARVMLETWAEMNLYCLNCANDALARHSANTPLSDFYCETCAAQYQVKAKNGRFGPVLAGADYRITSEAAARREMPEYVLVEYDTRFSTVVFVDAIPGIAITAERIVARRALADSARRKGWVGCTIRIEGLPSARIVAPAGVGRDDVRAEWRSLDYGASRLRSG